MHNSKAYPHPSQSEGVRREREKEGKKTERTGERGKENRDSPNEEN